MSTTANFTPPARRAAVRREPAAREAGRARRFDPAARATDRAATRSLPARERRRRAALALLAVAVAGVLAVGPGLGADAAQPGSGTVLVVGEGETIWALTLPHVPAGTDPAVYVAEVVAANGLDAIALAPGTVVRLP